MKIYPYNMKSKSAIVLADALEIKRIKHDGKRIEIKDVLINWGCSNIEREIICPNILNLPDNVTIAVNKLQAFKCMQGYVSIPKWTESREEAIKWLAEDVSIVCRTVLNGHSGNGIVIAKTEKELVDAPLYVRYTPKKEEYRIHVFMNQVFFVQQKKRNKNVPDNQVDWQVRNHGNGFIYANKDVDFADVAKEQAIMAIKILGLDFGAVDVIWNEKQNMYYVLEVNCAPGLSGTTLDKYVEQFRKYF